jgi:glutaminyl-peptide cyclotransferase
MKYYNLLSVITLTLIIVACGGGKKDDESYFSFDNSVVKEQYSTNESINIALKNAENKKIDSVIYYFNDKKISSKKGLDKLSFSLNTEKFGVQNLKALVYFEGESQEIVSKVEVFSPIEPKLLDFKIVNTFPHDVEAYTQGLEFYRDTLFEGTGNGMGESGKKGISSIRKVDYRTGKVYSKVEYPENVFGEGITILNNKIYQLTYKNNEAYVLNVDKLNKEKTLPYFQSMEGWGLTSDGKNLYMTDSTEKMHILSSETLKQIDFINIYSGSKMVPSVNELEWVDGKIYGNVYQKNAIAIINPKNGAVESIVNLADLDKKITHLQDTDVLNGIAYNSKTKTFFVTGKNWDKMFEIKIIQ